MSLYSKILRNTVLPFLLAREHQSSALSHFKFLQESQFWSLDRIHAYQLEQLQKLVNHSYKNTIYYKEIMDEPGYLEGVLRDGADKANEVANITVRDVRDALGFYQPR